MNNNININNESENYDKYILRRVKIKFPHIRKHKYSDEYCLSLFKLMLNDFVNWPSLKEAKKYMDEAPDYHYKYLNSVFNKWSNENIFEDAYLDMLNDKYFQLEHIKNTNEIPIFIDCSFINNMNGINCKASNPEYRKKKCTKISAISDSKNNIISLTYDKTHLSKNNIPFVLTPHGAYNTIAMQRSGITKKLYFLLFEKFLLKKVNRIHSLGESEVVGLNQLFPNSKSFLLPYGYEVPNNVTINKVPSEKFIIFISK